MPRLPDIPLQSWLEDQQKRFLESTEGYIPALDFAMGTRAAEAGIPPDYDAPGGRDQWDEAELQQKQEEYRRAQRDSEEAARQQQAEQERQIQEQAQQYQQMQAQAEQEQQARDEQNRSAVMDQIRSLGIPTPSDAFAMFKEPSDSTSTSGVFDVGAPSPSAASGNQNLPPEEQFNQYASGMMTDAFGAPTPDPTQNRDNSSTSGVFGSLADAASRVGSTLSEAPGALRNVVDRGLSAVEDSPFYPGKGLAEQYPGTLGAAADPIGAARQAARGADYLVENYGAKKLQSDINEMGALEDEIRAASGQTGAGSTKVPEDWAAANPEKAVRYEELQRQAEGLVMGASGTMGGGGLAEDAITAIKALYTAGLDDAARAAEQNLAQKTTMTLDEILQRTRGTEPAAGRPAAVEPESTPAPISEAAQPPPNRSYTPDEARQLQLPGFEDVPQPDVRSGEGIRGYGELPRSTSREAGGMTRDQEDIIRAGARGIDTEVPSLNAAQRRTIASEMLQEEPGIVDRLLKEPVNPVRAGAEQEILRENVRTKGDVWEDAYHGLQDAQQQWDNALIEARGDVSKIPEDVSANKAYWANEMGDALTQLSEGIRGTSLRAKAASKVFNAQRGGLEGARMLTEANRVQQVADAARTAARGVRRAVQSPNGVIDEETSNQLGSVLNQLKNPRTRRVLTREKPGEVTGPPIPKEETLIERLGRLKRIQGGLEDKGVEVPQALRDEIGDIIQQMGDEAETMIRQRLAVNKAPLTAAESERIINESIGRRVQSRIRREELRRQKGLTGYEGDISRDVERGITQHYQKATRDIQNEFLKLFRSNVEVERREAAQLNRRINSRLGQNMRAQQRAEIKALSQDVIDWERKIRQFPGQRAEMQPEFDLAIARLKDHSNAGEQVARDLVDRLDTRLQEDAYQKGFRESQRATRAVEAAHIDSIIQQIEELRSNTRMPDRVARIGNLLNGLENLGVAGRQRASDIRLRAQTEGVLKSGAFASDVDRTALNQFLMHLDPNKPETMKPILNLMNKPTAWEVAREVPFINMLSNPLTHATNITSTVANVMLRLLLRNPVEQVLSGGTLTGSGAAFRGAARGFSEGAQQAKQTFLTGLNPRRLENVAARGDVRHAGREALPAYLENTIPEIFGSDVAKRAGGKLGEAMHMVSTRPLEAMDAWMGQMAYGSAIDQLAAREANKLIRTGRDELLELGRPTNQAELHQYILDNIHDFPDLIKQAGNVEDYLLFRSNEKGRIEGFLRGLSRLKEGGPNTTVGEKVLGWLADYIMPFTRVPLNFTKQGFGNVAAPVLETTRAGVAGVRGDREAMAEHGAKAIQGLALLSIPTWMAADDNLTGPGPRDPGQRQVWELDHKPNSWRWNRNSPWISYEGTPWAIPFATVAGVKEYFEFKKPEEDVSPTGQAVGIAGGALHGGIRGAISQSLISGTLRNVETLAGEGLGESYTAGAQEAANAVARYTPTGAIAPSGLLNFLAQVTDRTERDVGRAKNYDQGVEVLGNVLESRIPGARQQLPERRNAYGQVVERPTAKGFLGYQGYLPNESDMITNQLEAGKVGIPRVGAELTIGTGKIPLTIREQQRFQELYGAQYREMLEYYYGSAHPPQTDQQLEIVRTRAREIAGMKLQQEIGDDSVRRRWKRTPPTELPDAEEAG